MEFSKEDKEFLEKNRHKRYREQYPYHSHWHYIKGAYAHSRCRLHVLAFAEKYGDILKEIQEDAKE